MVLSRQAERYYSNVDDKTARRLNKAFEVLESNPRPTSAKALKGPEETADIRRPTLTLPIIYQRISA
jgi:hypothetical protein